MNSLSIRSSCLLLRMSIASQSALMRRLIRPSGISTLICFHLTKTIKSRNKKLALRSYLVTFFKEMLAEMLLKLFNKLLDLNQRVKLINCYLLSGTWSSQVQKKLELHLLSRICGPISKEKDLFLFYFNSRENKIIRKLFLVHTAVRMLLVFLLHLIQIKNTQFLEMTLTLSGAGKKERDFLHLNCRKASKLWSLLLTTMVVVL